MDQERTPGWYPDPRRPGRMRHWDGDRWNELSAAAGPDADGESPPLFESPPPLEPGAAVGTGSRRVGWAIGAAVLVAAVLAAVFLFVVLGGSEEPPTDQAASTDERPAPSTDGTSTSTQDPADERPGGSDPEGGATPETTATYPSTAQTPPSTPAAPPDPGCTVPAAELLDALRAYEPLAAFADELVVSDPRCAGDWATAVVSTPSTDAALAVLRRSNEGRSDGGWTVVMIGSAEPCSGLGIPGEYEAQLGCDFR